MIYGGTAVQFWPWMAGVFDALGAVYEAQGGMMGITIPVPTRALGNQISAVAGGRVTSRPTPTWRLTSRKDLMIAAESMFPYVRGQQAAISVLLAWLDGLLETDLATDALAAFYAYYPARSARARAQELRT